jgi:hypothetical protein
MTGRSAAIDVAPISARLATVLRCPGLGGCELLGSLEVSDVSELQIWLEFLNDDLKLPV